MPRKKKERPQVPPFLTLYADEIEERREKYRKRKAPMAQENMPPVGFSYVWYQTVVHYVPRSGMAVAKQLARLAKGEATVTISNRSLADAVGIWNKAGNLRSYTERGVEILIEAGWLKKEIAGTKRGATTTYYLKMGDFTDQSRSEEEEDGFTEEDLLESF
ncbi:hypothetical protein ACQYWQ_21765 [Streptomyces sp. P6-2-1]|uniref:hypothetical protein n=1 Tax=Streptomyces sp. P6-2-1 TaxID=3422591 RepID=UPI003D36BD0A